MPYLYAYSPSDFVEGLPAESGAQAAGTPGVTLTLKADTAPAVIELNGNDLVFDEVDSPQSLAQTVNIDSVAAGTTINSAYDLINSGTGHKATSFHFGGDGYQQGPVDGIASTVALTPEKEITTADHDAQPLRTILRREVSTAELRTTPSCPPSRSVPAPLVRARPVLICT